MLPVLQLLKKMHPNKVILLDRMPFYDVTLLSNVMYLWKDEVGDWAYRIIYLDYMKENVLDEDLDRKSILILNQLDSTGELGDITAHWRKISTGHLALSRSYLKFNLDIQLFIVAELTSLASFSLVDIPSEHNLEFSKGLLSPSTASPAVVSQVTQFYAQDFPLLVRKALKKLLHSSLSQEDKQMHIEQFVKDALHVFKLHFEAEVGVQSPTIMDDALQLADNSPNRALSQLKAKYCYWVKSKQDLPKQLAPSTIYVWHDPEISSWYYCVAIADMYKIHDFDPVYDLAIYNVLNSLAGSCSQDITHQISSGIIDKMSESLHVLDLSNKFHFLAYLGDAIFSPTLINSFDALLFTLSGQDEVFQKKLVSLISLSKTPVISNVDELIFFLNEYSPLRTVCIESCKPHLPAILKNYSDISKLIDVLSQDELNLCLNELAAVCKKVVKSHIELQFILCDLTELDCLRFLTLLDYDILNMTSGFFESKKFIHHSNIELYPSLMELRI